MLGRDSVLFPTFISSFTREMFDGSMLDAFMRSVENMYPIRSAVSL
jgi:hypothetical protein